MKRLAASASNPSPRPLINPFFLAALALILLYHGSLLLGGSYQRTYDAYVHIFFADHYARNWFDHWDERWYTGFTLTSYPPGAQQLIALCSRLIGLPYAFILVQTVALLWMALGVYRFARLWVSDEAAGYATLLMALSSSIAQTVHVFGQLPTILSLGFLLNALPFVAAWLRTGRGTALLAAWALNAATTAVHHVTTLFGAVFFVAPVLLLVLTEALRTPRADEPTTHAVRLTRHTLRQLIARRLRRILPELLRTAVYLVGLLAALVIVVLPYWLWSRTDPITQVPIPHASRESFLENINAGLIFWVIPYGITLLAIPYVVARGLSTRAWPLILVLAPLMLLGSGGTTPLPRLLLGGAYDILTFDRFTFWATIVMLPLLGEFVVSLRHGRLAAYLREQFGTCTLRSVQATLFIGVLLTSIFTANLTQFRRFQPPPIDMAPIVTFLEKDQHWRWRYLTLGFGDQMAWLSAQTSATTVDGNYHSARRLPELTTTPIERLEGAKFRGVPGLGSLQQFLTMPEKYHLKFVFSYDPFYDPLLFFSGWHRIQRLENGIVVWEREDIPPLPAVLPRREIPLWQRLMWGILPITSIALALLAVALVRPSRTSVTARTRPPAGWYAALDRRLRIWSEHADHESTSAPSSRPQPAAHISTRSRPAAPGIRYVRQALLLIIVVASLGVSLHWYLEQLRSPIAQLEAYYNDLDLRRFESAYERLDPQTRPSLEQYMLERSVRGGLIASYGKLNSVQAELLRSEPGRLTFNTHVTWLTSLAEYPQTREHTLIERSGRWYLEPDTFDPTTPPDTFFSVTAVEWVAQGRRRVTTGPTDYADLLDRPQLQVLDARLVQYDGRYQLLGEVRNTDTDPADTTVTGILYDERGNELTRYNAQTAMIHKLLPGETTPFRIDFEGVAGTLLTDTLMRDFRPDDFTPPSLLSPATDFHVAARAVVTGRNLDRTLAVQDMNVEIGVTGTLTLTGRLLNIGAQEATVPHMLITLYDQRGRVAWVADHTLDQAVRPQRSVPFSITIPPRIAIRTLLENSSIISETSNIAAARNDLILLAPESGYAAFRISVHALQEATP